MALAKIDKINLIAMSYDRDAILNALQRTGAVEIKTQTQQTGELSLSVDGEGLAQKLAEVESALNYITVEGENYEKDRKIKSDLLADGFAVSYSEFMGADKLEKRAEFLVNSINAVADEKKRLLAEITKTRRARENAEIYAGVKNTFNYYADSLRVKVRLGTVAHAATAQLEAAEAQNNLLYFEKISAFGDFAVILAAAHKSAAGELEAALQTAGFSACQYGADVRSGEQLYEELSQKLAAAEAGLAKNADDAYELCKEIKDLKIYADYLAFELEKKNLSEKMEKTQTTFTLEGYVPAEAEEQVKEAIEKVSGAVYVEFSEPAEDEVPPTLYKNNEVVKNFEVITNMYSPANAREFDPNTIMAVFYSIFLGFIIADMGYGLLMFFGGGVIYMLKRAQDGGLKRLAGVFAIGGIFAVIWGLLFNSFCGISFGFMPTLMPNPKDDMWSLMGISVPAVLIISLEVGIVQLCAGYVCKAVQYWRRGKILDGIFEGVTWAVFSVGVGLAIVGFLEEANMGILGTVGGIIAGVSLLAAVLTAGRHEKLLGKFTKGFGAAYGVINYASDILSYARLYGLMLSGAVIAQIVSTYSVQFITGGNVAFAILGVVLMLVGHAFNLAMSLLGAYIHDARLQYVEFYGRFYEGEGELFTPLGSNRKYININN